MQSLASLCEGDVRAFAGTRYPGLCSSTWSLCRESPLPIAMTWAYAPELHHYRGMTP